ncbi:MAG: ankyrin repeat domain-containing protein [Armatimonadetes bacterium]|nr:ankyrin repeat domain-containing protein [Armatimonadota bacterium]
MMNAVFDFKPSMAALLKAGGASTKKFDAKSAGLIGTAIQVESIKVLEETLKIAGSVNEVAPDGTTPMHLAVKMQRREQAEFLLRHGAKLDSRDKSGKTPLDYAKTLQHPGDREMWVAFLTGEGKRS